MIESEWIKLLVKFKGKCQLCEKQISAGDYALWSKSSKKIKHLDCNNNNNNKVKKETDERDIGLNLRCFLCGNTVQNISPDDFDFLNRRSQKDFIFLCKSCLENPKSYLKYQDIIYEKIKKIVKLKS
ncbi:MAG TPA: hypothetical protein VLA48_10425 [Nitrososphaeraceae archaeon]|nr:hypothetical protein [Nitrososphaeraceae archaeon]